MTILFIIIAIAFTLRMVVAMVAPFWGSRKEQLSFELLDEELREVESLVARRVALVQALRDIEYDFKTNKISREDYERFKTSCERQAVGVMRRLDAIHGGDRDWDEVIDRAVQQRLDVAPSASTAGSDAGVCTDCNAPLADDDHFCSQCGASVEEEEVGGFDAHSRFAAAGEVAG